MFGEGAISSSESPAPSACGVPETVLPFRMLRIGERSLPMRCSRFCPPEIEVICGSLLKATLEGGRGNVFTIWQSVGDNGEAWVVWVLPLFGVASRSGVQCLIGVRALSGVWDQSEVRGTWDWPRPDLTNPVLFLLTWGEWVLSGVLPELAGREPPPCWLGPLVVGGLWTKATSPTTS